MSYKYNVFTDNFDIVQTFEGSTDFGFVKNNSSGGLEGGHSIHDVIDDQLMAMDKDCNTGFKYNSTSEKVEVIINGTKVAEFG